MSVSGSGSPDPPSFEPVAAVREAVRVRIGEADVKVGGVWGGTSDEDADAVRRCRA